MKDNNFWRHLGGLVNFRPMAKLPSKSLPTELHNYTFDIINDGVSTGINIMNNAFPNYLTEIVSASPHASAAVRKLTEFVTGKKLLGEDSQVPVNQKETIQELHYKIASDLAFFHRFATKIILTRGGDIDQIYHLPVENIRYTWPDDKGKKCVAYSTLWNTSDNNKSRLTYYPLWYPGITPAEIREDISYIETKYKQEYKGHVHYHNITNQRNRIYSRPPWSSADNYIMVDGKIGLFHERNVDNNFFLGGIMTVPGDPEMELKDPNTGKTYSTVGEEFAKQMAMAHSGADQAGNIMVFWRQNEADPEASFTAFQPNNNHEAFNLTMESCRQVITSSIGIPQVLLGVSQAGRLGDTQEINNAVKFVNENTANLRQILVDTYFNYEIEDIDIKPISIELEMPAHIFDRLPQKLQIAYAMRQYDGLDEAAENIDFDLDTINNTTDGDQ